MGITAVLSAVGGLMAAQTYQQYDASKRQAAASKQAAAAASKQATAQEAAINKANAKSPDIGAMLAANMQAARAGGSSTLLTGPQGVDSSSLTLGRSTLLGG